MASTTRSRRVLARHRGRVGYLDGINNAAQAVAAGGSGLTLIDQVSGQLVPLLSLWSCIFQYGVAWAQACYPSPVSPSSLLLADSTSSGGRRTLAAAWMTVPNLSTSCG